MLPNQLDDRYLYRMVDEVLHYVWDPIGVADMPRARDEYYAYVPATFRLLRDGADETALAAHLDGIAAERMGLSPDDTHSLKASRMLIEWREIVRLSPSTLRTEPPPMPDYET